MHSLGRRTTTEFLKRRTLGRTDRVVGRALVRSATARDIHRGGSVVARKTALIVVGLRQFKLFEHCVDIFSASSVGN